MTHPIETVIYTCVSKGYDWLRPIDSKGVGVEFVCFTDQPDKVPNGWRTLPLQSPPRLKSGHDINRFHKIFPHLLFPAHRYSVYVDGNVEYLGDYEDLIERFKQTGCALGAFRHPGMRNLSSEADACWRLNKFDAYDLSRSEEQIRVYKEFGFDVSRTISANYLLVRDHQYPRIRFAMSLWWAHLFEFTKRDQLSLNFSLWKENVPFVFLDEVEGVDSSSILRRPHKYNLFKKLFNKAMRLAKGFFT